jgi:hypothetical protein
MGIIVELVRRKTVQSSRSKTGKNPSSQGTMNAVLCIKIGIGLSVQTCQPFTHSLYPNTHKELSRLMTRLAAALRLLPVTKNCFYKAGSLLMSFLQQPRLSLAIFLLLLLSASPTSLGIIPTAQAAEMAQGFSPQRYKSGTDFGTGVYFAPYRFTLYSEPKDGAATIAVVEWSQKSSINGIRMSSPGGSPMSAYADKLFISYYPTLNVAMMAVVSENGQGWAEVVYDQQAHKTAWVRLGLPDETQPKSTASADDLSHFGVFQTWFEFMKLNAKSSGIYWLTGVADYNRALRSKDEDTAKLISITIIRKLKVRYVRGNWLLVEIQDFEMNSPIGWVRWRDDDGNLMIFPNLSGQTRPMMSTY